jgi:hypothetical protein
VAKTDEAFYRGYTILCADDLVRYISQLVGEEGEAWESRSKDAVKRLTEAAGMTSIVFALLSFFVFPRVISLLFSLKKKFYFKRIFQSQVPEKHNTKRSCRLSVFGSHFSGRC